MRLLSPLLLLLLLVVLSGCENKKSPSSTEAGVTSTPATASAPVSSGTAVSIVPAAAAAVSIDTHGAAACIPKAATSDEAMVSAVVTGSNKEALSFCLGDKAEHGCFAVDLASGKYTALPKAAPIKKQPASKTSTFGTHLLEGLEKEVKVCPVSALTNCVVIDVGKGYRQSTDAPLPADVSPDGKKLTVVRFLEGVTMNVDIYDLETKQRLSRDGVEGRGNLVVDVGWLAKRIFISSCVDAGPGCTPLVWDPESKKVSSAAANVYGVNRPAHKVDETTWAFIDGTGSSLALIDIDTGFRRGEVKLPLEVDVQNSVSVAPLGEGKVAIVGGAPQAGVIEIVDMNNAPKLVKKLTPAVCK